MAEPSISSPYIAMAVSRAGLDSLLNGLSGLLGSAAYLKNRAANWW